MRIDKYLIINNRGGMLVRENEPRGLKANEVALRINVDIPDALFRRPILEAVMKVPGEAVPKNKVSVEVTDNIEKIIKQTTGLNMKVNIIEANTDEDESITA